MIVPFGVIILNDRMIPVAKAERNVVISKIFEEGGKIVNDEIYLTAFSSDHSFPEHPSRFHRNRTAEGNYGSR
jgi:hypothetical protein